MGGKASRQARRAAQLQAERTARQKRMQNPRGKSKYALKQQTPWEKRVAAEEMKKKEIKAGLDLRPIQEPLEPKPKLNWQEKLEHKETLKLQIKDVDLKISGLRLLDFREYEVYQSRRAALYKEKALLERKLAELEK